MPTVADAHAVGSLRLWHCCYRTLDALAAFSHLRILVIATFPDKTLDVVAKLRRLTYLRILHLPHVTDLSPLTALPSLESLALETLPSWDASGKVTVVESLAPIAALPGLRHLQLFGVRPADKSLKPLEQCGSLKTGRFSKFPKREVDRFHEATGVRNDFIPEPAYDAG